MEPSIDQKEINEFSILQKALLDNFNLSEELGNVRKRLEKPAVKEHIQGLNNTTKALIIAFLSTNIKEPLLVITPNISSALKLQVELSWLTDLPVKLLTGAESSPYEMAYSPSNTLKEQLECLEIFVGKKPAIIVCNAKALLNTYLTPVEFDECAIKLAVGLELDPQYLIEMLVGIGYSRVSMVMDPGEFSIRGDICDIYPISSPPVRIEFAFDEVESIRHINIETQRSIENIEKLSIRPRYKVVITEEKKQTFINDLKMQLEKDKTELDKAKFQLLEENYNNTINQLKEFTYFEGIEYFAPYFHENLANITDYLTNNNMIFIDEFNEVENNLIKQEEKYTGEYKQGLKSARLLNLPYLLHKEASKILNQIDNSSVVYLKTLPDNTDNKPNCLELHYQFIPSFLKNLKKAAEFIKDLKRNGYKIVITTEYPQRVKSVLSEWNCETVYLSPENLETILPEDIIITKIGTTTGFLMPEFKLAAITDTELFGKVSKKPTISKKTSKREDLDYFLSPSDLHENDFVVHARHGIGKFTILQKITIDNQERDYLTIEYAGKDKLYVPVDQINLLSRYRGVGDAPPRLSKMGGVDWETIKRKAQNAVENIAMELLNLYATRAKMEGFTFDPDSNWQQEMEEAFEYIETPDQLRAIIDVKSDMESNRPMDRLICGDVGYGKTEVAIRAVFKAIMTGKQVAFLVPTTILAQQHFNTFTERFLPYPINIAMLSRFRTPKDQKQAINRLVTGELDMVIGTHRLLQKDVEFKNLGLVVIDEEHRFGVRHKERLKHLRTQVEVISMSATPIPRTLYMALSGIRDMSVINTPPVNRSPIKTTVGEYSKNIVRSAILYELERGGQVYYVHNRVQSIHKVALELSELVPEAKIIVAHGQMNEKELETTMLDFSVHKYDVLVCTTIIESGLDIPNVNTIIIDDSDCMGLAQLYQLRGRVGRSDRQAYAYCFYKPKKILTPEAKKRLMAIMEFNTLGSGYQVALRDLEIRGIGNILGSQQHGNMVAVGFDLYCEMLDEAVKKLKGQPAVKKELPIVDINITAFIPDAWIGDKEQKIVEYKRLAAVKSQRELEIIAEEWQDRFGNIPKEVRNLITIVKIRLLASEVGFNLIREEQEFIRIFTNYDFNFWHNFTKKIPSQLINRTKWVKLPQTSIDGLSAILIKYRGLTPQHLLNFIEELCCYLNNYLKDNKGA